MNLMVGGLLVMLFACAGAPAPVSPRPPTPEPNAAAPIVSEPSAELERMSVEWMEAMIRHDRTRLESLMAPEYVLRNWDDSKQVRDRTAWLDALFNHLKIEKWEQKAIAAQVYGDVGVVTSKYIWIGSFDGKGFDSRGYLTDIFVRGPAGWRVVSRTSGGIPGSKLIDGTVSVW
ncbi:MAG: nuclear transport factor 2 family protein [Myxococcota bacterium]|nr:nuclear transport factor 2 family protein [Deltaproteobacteria bacterium]MDQ3338967.1 nuclear transport factor 2 family protein [Myxococcota bacterium]